MKIYTLLGEFDYTVYDWMYSRLHTFLYCLEENYFKYIEDEDLEYYSHLWV